MLSSKENTTQQTVIKGKSKPKKQDLERELKFKLKDNSIEELSDTIGKLEDQMYVYAKDMEFEKAAWCRDKMKYLKGKMIDI